MRILITGAEGQLGRALQSALEGTDIVALSHAQLDVTDRSAVHEVVASSRPDVVVHAAALTDTVRCEREPESAMAVNAAGTEAVATAAAAVGARLIAISTNEVFDGQSPRPYAEADQAAPINAYGRSKLEGERRALAAHPEAAIVRTSWVYGDGANNFVAKVLSAARLGRPLRFVTDEVASPTSAAELAEAIRALIERRDARGVYHLSNQGGASRYEWASEIVRLARIPGVTVEPTTTADLRAAGFDGPAKPPYSVLENTRARDLGITMRPWRRPLAEFLEHRTVRADG